MLDNLTEFLDRNRSWILTGILAIGIILKRLGWVSEADFDLMIAISYGPIMTHKAVQQIKEKEDNA